MISIYVQYYEHQNWSTTGHAIVISQGQFLRILTLMPDLRFDTLHLIAATGKSSSKISVL